LPLPEHIARAVCDLCTREDFVDLWKYFEKQADEMSEIILDSNTDPVTREVLVRVHEIFRREVVDLPSRSVNEVNRTTAGQAKAPA